MFVCPFRRTKILENKGQFLILNFCIFNKKYIVFLTKNIKNKMSENV